MGLHSQVVVLAVLFGAVLSEKTKIVDTKQGKVEGNLASSGHYYEFLGLRYAEPVRFKVIFQSSSSYPTYIYFILVASCVSRFHPLSFFLQRNRVLFRDNK